jgi:hypothetical protein
LSGKFIEQGFHFIQESIQSFDAPFKARKCEAQLTAGRAPGFQSVIRQDLGGESPCLKQGQRAARVIARKDRLNSFLV